MKDNFPISRRIAVKSSIFGLLAVPIPSISHGSQLFDIAKAGKNNDKRSARYPAIDDEITHEVVSVSHGKLDRLKVLVDKRPELARATWDWRFGDWETAIGAASHVGRRDIVEYLISMGARPDLFTFATLGAFKTVKTLIEYSPGVQKTLGPHGISLLDHARAGLRMKDKMTKKNINNSKKLIAYLEALGNADGQKYVAIEEKDKEQYLGDYKYGPGEKDGFTISLNMRKMIALAEIGAFGGSLYKKDENKFTYQGSPSVTVSFQFSDKKVTSLTIQEPDLTLKAVKI